MEFDLEYNGERPHLIIPEYGRHIQKLVDNCVALEDVEERNKMAKAIVDVMGNLQPHLRDVPDFKHKLWDQLFIMSDFKLDIESPYPKPELEKLAEKPEPMEYPGNKIRFSYYGNTIQSMIETAMKMEGIEKEVMTGMIANHMKKSYLLFNKHSVSNDTIKLHLDQLSENKLKLAEDFEFIRSDTVVTKTAPKVYKKKFKKRR